MPWLPFDVPMRRGDQMRHFWFGIEQADLLLQHPIGIGDALVLAEMLQP